MGSRSHRRDNGQSQLDTSGTDGHRRHGLWVGRAGSPSTPISYIASPPPCSNLHLSCVTSRLNRSGVAAANFNCRSKGPHHTGGQPTFIACPRPSLPLEMKDVPCTRYVPDHHPPPTTSSAFRPSPLQPEPSVTQLQRKRTSSRRAHPSPLRPHRRFPRRTRHRQKRSRLRPPPTEKTTTK